MACNRNAHTVCGIQKDLEFLGQQLRLTCEGHHENGHHVVAHWIRKTGVQIMFCWRIES